LPAVNEARLLERKTKNILALKYALTETYNYSFLGEEQLKKLNIDFFNYLKLANPLNDNQILLRQSLAPGLVNTIKINQQRPENLGFFEIGDIFWPAPGNLKKEASGDSVLPHQEKHLGIALAGEGDLFGRLKGLINNLLQTLISYEIELDFTLLNSLPGWADSKRIAKIILFGKEIGHLGSLSQAATANYNLKKPVALLEINFSLLTSLILPNPGFRFQEAPKYPALIRDLAFVVDAKIMYNDLKADLLKFNPLIKAVEFFDVYSGDKLLSGQKSLAFHLTYQSETKTLTAAEVDVVQAELVSHLAQKFAAKLRDF
jgi:phenylalanyl-tRNA synthetase beta chain